MDLRTVAGLLLIGLVLFGVMNFISRLLQPTQARRAKKTVRSNNRLKLVPTIKRVQNPDPTQPKRLSMDDVRMVVKSANGQRPTVSGVTSMLRQDDIMNVSKRQVRRFLRRLSRQGKLSRQPDRPGAPSHTLIHRF